MVNTVQKIKKPISPPSKKVKKSNEEAKEPEPEEKIVLPTLDELYAQFEKSITDKMKPDFQQIMARYGIKTLKSDCLRAMIRILFKDFKDTLCELIKIARIRNLTNYLYLDSGESEKGKVMVVQPVVTKKDVKCSPFDIMYTSDPKSQLKLLEIIDTIKRSEKAKADQEKIKNEEFKGRSKKNKEKISQDPYKKRLIEKLEENKEKEKKQKYREEMQSTMLAFVGDSPAMPPPPIAVPEVAGKELEIAKVYEFYLGNRRSKRVKSSPLSLCRSTHRLTHCCARMR